VPKKADFYRRFSIFCFSKVGTAVLVAHSHIAHPPLNSLDRIFAWKSRTRSLDRHGKAQLQSR
jgi:hypothetical protein